MESGKKMMEKDLKIGEDIDRQKDKEIEELRAKNASDKQLLD